MNLKHFIEKYKPLLITEMDMELANAYNNRDDISFLERLASQFPSGEEGGLVFFNDKFGLKFKTMLLSRFDSGKSLTKESDMLDHLIENAFDYGSKRGETPVYLFWNSESFYIIDMGTKPIEEIRERVSKVKENLDPGTYSGTCYLNGKEYNFAPLLKNNRKRGTILEIKR